MLQLRMEHVFVIHGGKIFPTNEPTILGNTTLGRVGGLFLQVHMDTR